MYNILELISYAVDQVLAYYTWSFPLFVDVFKSQ